VRYNFNLGVYKPIDYLEWRSIPGIGVALDKRLFVLLEYVMAKRKNGELTNILDHCLSFTIHGKV
jgi:hypothetical protein